MKKLLFILCLGFFAGPVFLTAQEDCFSDRTQNDVSIFPTISEDMNCALREVGIDCPVETGTEVTISFSPQFQNSDFCDFWCNSQHPQWGLVSEQVNIFNRILAFAEANAPICAEDGSPMVLTNIVLDQDVLGQAFIVADLTFACCVLPVDCEADFVLEWDVNDCVYHATNASSASTFVDCGDCENPSGITSVSWGAGYYYTNGPWQSYTPLGSGDGYNFSFDVNGIGKFDYIEVCLRIEDCNGCKSTICKTITKLSPCFGFTGDDDESRRIINTEPLPAHVFPNPAANTINVNFNNDKFNADNAVIEMHDLQGRLIKSMKNVSEGLNTFDISDLINNVYLLSVVVDGERIHAERVVIEK